MVIIFRELTSEEKNQLDKELSYWLSEKNIKELYDENKFIVGEGNWRELFIVNPMTFNILITNENISPYSVGLGFGEYKKSGLLLSLGGGEIISDKTEKIAIIKDEAEQVFLHKRDIYSKSIETIATNVNIGDKVIIQNTKREFLGVGKLEQILDEIIKKKDSRNVALKNVLDLGWYLRKGK